MAEKMSQEKPDYIRPMGKFKNLEAVPTVVPMEGGSMSLSAKDVALLDRDTPAPPPRKAVKDIMVTSDDLGVLDPVFDVSQNVEVWYYECQTPGCKMGKHGKPYRVYAGSGDFELDAERTSILRGDERECDCIRLFIGEDGKPAPRLKSYQNPKISAAQYEHGVMKLRLYSVPRPKRG